MVLNSVMTGNKAIGNGANPAAPRHPRRRQRGAIYNDGDKYSLKIAGTVIRDNHAREGGGAIFFVSDQHRHADHRSLDTAPQPQRGLLHQAVPGHLLPQLRAPESDQLHDRLTRAAWPGDADRPQGRR